MSTPKQALVVRGGWDGHVPVAATDLFIPFLREQGYEVRVEEGPAVYADEKYMTGVDLILQSVTMSTITDDEVSGLMGAVRRGTGLVGWHGGIADSFRNNSNYLHLVGGQFACHPPKDAPENLRAGDETDNFITYTVDIVPEQNSHPIVAGLKSFELTTEQYWVLSDTHNRVLATTTLAAREFDPWDEPVVCPAVWTRQWGSGHVVVVTPGHSVDVLEHPSVRTLIERSITWATR